jgi:CBS domain-containing protein
MTACVVSTLVSQLLNRESIYTTKLMRQGIDIHKTEDPNVLKGLYVRDVVQKSPEVIPESANFQTILDLVVQSDHGEFFVVSRQNELLGAISLSEVRRLIYEQEALRHLVVARDLVDTSRTRVHMEDDLSVVMQIFSGSDIDEIAVVDPVAPKKLIGTVREKDVIEASHREQLRRDLAGSIETSVGAVGKGKTVDLGDGYQLREIIAPPHMFGRSLMELAIRERTGVQVLLVRAAQASAKGHKALRVPNPTDRLEEGQTLIVAGTADGLEALEAMRQ